MVKKGQVGHTPFPGFLLTIWSQVKELSLQALIHLFSGETHTGGFHTVIPVHTAGVVPALSVPIPATILGYVVRYTTHTIVATKSYLYHETEVQQGAWYVVYHLFLDCNGKVCENGGHLDVNSCLCTCTKNYHIYDSCQCELPTTVFHMFLL